MRQYFTDESFYAEDMDQRGLCDVSPGDTPTTAFICDAFSPSAATVKVRSGLLTTIVLCLRIASSTSNMPAFVRREPVSLRPPVSHPTYVPVLVFQAMLVNSANLMGESSEPDGHRGFGRIHLGNGMPLAGEGNMVLFVADAFYVQVDENSVDEYAIEIMTNMGLDLRATLTWMDPAASVESSIQLIHDLDLTVTAPDGTVYRMWSDGSADTSNVVERVIVPSDVLGASNGTWVVAVSAGDLTTTSQPYSLVVTGPMGQAPSDTNTALETGGAVVRMGPAAVAPFVTAVVAAALAVCVFVVGS